MERYLALHRSLQRCGSSLETKLLLAWLATPTLFSFAPKDDLWVDGAGVELRVQVPIAGFKADFTLSGCLAIEVDGAIWHDGSPLNAERDRRRDRALLARGWRVLRFSEREVNEDALSVARECYALAGDTALHAFRRPVQTGLNFR